MVQTELPPQAKVFIFGSAVEGDQFHDIDIGIEGLSDTSCVNHLQELFEESRLPYNVDVIDFDRVDENFKHSVMKEKILWLT